MQDNALRPVDFSRFSRRRPRTALPLRGAAALVAAALTLGQLARPAGAVGRAGGAGTVADGPDRGRGHDNPNKSPIVRGFPLTADEQHDLIAFLGTLTDTELLRDPRFANPWLAAHEEDRWR